MNFEKLFSRKLLLSLAGVMLVALNRKLHLGLTPADVATIAGIIVGGVMGLSLPDAVAEWKKGAATDAAEDPKPPAPAA